MFVDSKGRWWIDYYTPDKKRRRKIAGKTKADADRLLRAIRGSVDRGEYIDPSNSPLFSEFCAVFMERYGQHKSSYMRNPRAIERLKEYFGRLKLAKITSGHIEQFRIDRLAHKSERDDKTPLSLTTVNRDVEIIRSMLARAVKWKYLAKNPATDVEDHDEDNKRERFLSVDEIHRLIRATKNTRSPLLRPAVYLALQTGMRKAELLGLKWSDIHFDAGKILCRETKSGEPRHVPMSRRSKWVLHKLAARNPLSTWVFESYNRLGVKAPARDIKTAWIRALRLARIEKFRFHDLRHTFASHFAMAEGNSLYALAEILGHSNPKITLDRYAHLSPKYVNEQRHVMNRMYASGSR